MARYKIEEKMREDTATRTFYFIFNVSESKGYSTTLGGDPGPENWEFLMSKTSLQDAERFIANREMHRNQKLMEPKIVETGG
jgi:hypothetical protein